MKGERFSTELNPCTLNPSWAISPEGRKAGLRGRYSFGALVNQYADCYCWDLKGDKGLGVARAEKTSKGHKRKPPHRKSLPRKRFVDHCTANGCSTGLLTGGGPER